LDLSVTPAPAQEIAAALPCEGEAIVTKRLVPRLQKQEVSALAAAIVTSDGLVSSGVAGFRKKGSPEPVTLADHWHLGSLTKAMTATLAARLVEEGTVTWNDTPWPADPSAKEPQAPTLADLLNHSTSRKKKLRHGMATRIPALGWWERLHAYWHQHDELHVAYS
jgi:CubicO group peptidase (beta-lactamase class C family)